MSTHWVNRADVEAAAVKARARAEARWAELAVLHDGVPLGPEGNLMAEVVHDSCTCHLGHCVIDGNAMRWTPGLDVDRLR